MTGPEKFLQANSSCNSSGCRTGLFKKIVLMEIICGRMVLSERNSCHFGASYYCALWGFWCLNILFSQRFPLGEHTKWRCRYAPPQKGYLSDTCAIPSKTRQNTCDTPLCDTILKGSCAIWGVSRIGPLSACPSSPPKLII